MSEFKLQDRISDPEASRISSYFCQLFLLVGHQSIQYSILDPDSNTFIALAAYKLEGNSENTRSFAENIAGVIEKDPVLQKKYPSVVIGVQTPYHSLIPSALFERDKIMTYLDFYYKLDDAVDCGFDRIAETDAVNAFGFNSNLSDFVARYFSGAVIVHSTTAFLKSALQASVPGRSSMDVYLNVRPPCIDIAVIENNRLTFFNSFSVRSHEDVLYYTLYTLDQLNSGKIPVNLSLCGIIDTGSSLPGLLEEYIGPVTYLSLPSGFNYSPLMKQANSHFYTELFGLALCGS